MAAVNASSGASPYSVQAIAIVSGHRRDRRGAWVAVGRQRDRGSGLDELAGRRRARPKEERGGGQEHRDGGVGSCEGCDPLGVDMVQVVGAPGAERHRRRGRAGRVQLLGMHTEREPRGRRGGPHGIQIGQREGDVLDVDVDCIDESFGGGGGDQFRARDADPLTAIHAGGHGVRRQEGDGARLCSDLGREAASEPRLA